MVLLSIGLTQMLTFKVTYRRVKMMSQVKFVGDPDFINCHYSPAGDCTREPP